MVVVKSHESRPRFDEQAALRAIVEGTATVTGERFFAALIGALSDALGTMGAWVATFEGESTKLRAVAMKHKGRFIDDFAYEVMGTPCQVAIDERRTVHIPDRVVELFRDNARLAADGAVSYLGVPLIDSHGAVIGQLAVLDDKPMPPEPGTLALFRIFASRATAELERIAAERAVREREAQLSELVESAMDAVVNFDRKFRVIVMNRAARAAFVCVSAGQELDVRELFASDCRQRLEGHAQSLAVPAAASTGSLWIAGGLDAKTTHGQAFRVEATLSHYRLNGEDYFTLILRNVEERRAAEARIESLTRETEYLREELSSLGSSGIVLGSSAPLQNALHEVERVAPTDTTVLLLGETGTGKELFARAVHDGSRRRERPLVKLNCGAIPHQLIESELFGHERGAFTGATQRREGRFALADGGTLFLDEIGELPLELQPKLLRVLQEGELELVGSSRTRKVDVRIVAATHRDLAECVARGTFREDLYYRLAVFPIQIPPLRERGRDIDELSRAFVEKYARRIGRKLEPLSEEMLARLRAYSWPGNVRELANVMERGVIISTGRTFDLERALPSAAPARRPDPPPVESPAAPSTPAILTARELSDLERKNLVRALTRTGWKVAGSSGAAALLGMNASTLSSRLRALDIRRPRR